MSLVELPLSFTGFRSTLRSLKVVLFKVVVVESFIKILVIVDPSTDHVGVLLMEGSRSRLRGDHSVLVETNMISGESVITV